MLCENMKSLDLERKKQNMEFNNIYCGDSYQLIKEIPDKSIDLIYTDIPYLIGGGVAGNSPLSQRIAKENAELGNKGCMENLKKKEQELKYKMDHAETREEYEKWHCQHSSILNKLNLESADIVDGIDYAILDEFVRIMKHIYIYGAVKTKYMTLCHIS